MERRASSPVESRFAGHSLLAFSTNFHNSCPPVVQSPSQEIAFMIMMRGVVTAMLAASFSLLAQDKSAAPQLKAYAVIRSGTLIDGKSDTPRHDQVIII